MERSFHCLVCADRPVFFGRLAAVIHARDCHASLLDDHHIDELFDWREAPESEGDDDVWFCKMPGCEGVRGDEDAIRSHLYSGHNLGNEKPLRFVHYWSGDDKIQAEREAAQEAQQLSSRFERQLASIVGVTDFLTECRA
jgi:hypothetical protein